MLERARSGLAVDFENASMTITRLSASAYTIPTDRPEADGTLTWDQTVMVLVEVSNGEHEGIGWTYAGASAVGIIDDLLAPVVIGSDEFRHSPGSRGHGPGSPEPRPAWSRRLRDLGRGHRLVGPQSPQPGPGPQ